MYTDEQIKEKATEFSDKLERRGCSFYNGLQIGYKNGFNDLQKEYEEKLRWIPIEELKNPTIPFLCKDKFGRIELFKFTSIKSLKAVDVTHYRNIFV